MKKIILFTFVMFVIFVFVAGNSSMVEAQVAFEKTPTATQDYRRTPTPDGYIAPTPTATYIWNGITPTSTPTQVNTPEPIDYGYPVHVQDEPEAEYVYVEEQPETFISRVIKAIYRLLFWRIK
jgi:hypothetical protein